MMGMRKDKKMRENAESEKVMNKNEDRESDENE